MSHKEDFFLLREGEEADDASLLPEETKKERKEKKSGKWKKVLLYAASFLALSFLALGVMLFLLFNGPSNTLRDTLVLSARQHSAIRWLPSLFLSDSTLSAIEKNGRAVITDTLSPEEIAVEETEDWVDGMRLIRIQKPRFQANLLIVKDPSRVFVGTASSFQGDEKGLSIFEITEKYEAVAGVYAGNYPDAYGLGDGSTPVSITYSQGKMVYSGDTKNAFIGMTKDNRLLVLEGLTSEEAEEKQIRDGVSFQNGSGLITFEDGKVLVHYKDKNLGRAQRTVIGQRADGAILLLTTEKQSVSDLGATPNELIDIMLSHGAVCAGIVDSGPSACLYYKDWQKSNENKSPNDNQKNSLVGENPADPRGKKMPTYFLVLEADKC